MTSLVVGATGSLGGAICGPLVERGKRVRGLVRSTSDRERVAWLESLGVELVEGDLQDRASLDRACVGVHAVLSTATVIRSRQAGDSFERTDRQGHLDLLGVVAGHGIERFVFVSFEGWLGPAAGWDLAARQARIWGDGDAKQNWVSRQDVVQVAVAALDDARAENAVIEIAGDYAKLE